MSWTPYVPPNRPGGGGDWPPKPPGGSGDEGNPRPGWTRHTVKLVHTEMAYWENGKSIFVPEEDLKHLPLLSGKLAGQLFPNPE